LQHLGPEHAATSKGAVVGNGATVGGVGGVTVTGSLTVAIALSEGSIVVRSPVSGAAGTGCLAPDGPSPVRASAGRASTVGASAEPRRGGRLSAAAKAVAAMAFGLVQQCSEVMFLLRCHYGCSVLKYQLH